MQGVVVPHFVKQLKHYSKKYRSLKDDLINFLECFDVRQHQSLGRGLYKARLRVRSIARGKSASFRIIILLVQPESVIVPVALYFKGDREDITEQEINDHLDVVLSELHIQGLFSPR